MEPMRRGLGNDPPFIRPVRDAGDHDAAIARAITDAIQYVETELGPEREDATNYYHGQPFGNEEAGRSQVVMTEVRDNILGALPGLLRVLHGPEHTVEFVPIRGDMVPAAEQATDYVRYVYEEDNRGFLVTHSTLKDGLLKRLGVIKWGMDTTPETTTTRYNRVTRDDLMELAQREGELMPVTDHGDGTFDVEHTVTIPRGRLWVLPIPPDDFFWNREARSLDDALIAGHRTRLTGDELRAMGVDEDTLTAFGGDVPVPTAEEVARRVTGAADQDTPMTDGTRKYVYCEAYVMLDGALRKVCTLGPTYFVLSNVPVDHRPFAVFTPDPEPHAMLGGSWYGLLKDAQKIDSQLMRGMLDSLAISLFPRTAYVDGQVSVADILNTAIGAPIRMRAPGMVQTFEQPFAGEKVLPVLSLMREVVERRVGQKDGAGSLDIDALQSTGAAAADAAIVAAQSTGELLVRLYAEQVMKPMFRGLLRLAAHPTSKERIIRLRGKYVPVQPASWDSGMDARVTVALGTTDPQKKIAVLTQVVADQTAILAEYGPENPVVTLAMLRNAKAKILALSGVADVESYYQPVPDDWQPPPPPPPEPSEEDKWRQAEAEMAHLKAMKELAIKQDELAFKTQQAEVENALRAREIAIKEADSVRDSTIGPHNAEIERYKADLDFAEKAKDRESREMIELAKIAVEREKIAAMASRGPANG